MLFEKMLEDVHEIGIVQQPSLLHKDTIEGILPSVGGSWDENTEGR